MAKAVRARSVVIHCDLHVVVKYINGNYKAKREQMKEYLSLAKDKMSEEFLAKFVQGLMGRKRASELFGQSCICRVYEHHKSGAILCPILPYH